MISTISNGLKDTETLSILQYSESNKVQVTNL